MIDGVKVVPLVAHLDDRGYLIEILRATDPHFSKFGQVYLVGNMARGTVRAFHEHKQMISTASEVYNRQNPDEVRVSPDSFGFAWEVKGR